MTLHVPVRGDGGILKLGLSWGGREETGPALLCTPELLYLDALLRFLYKILNETFLWDVCLFDKLLVPILH